MRFGIPIEHPARHAGKTGRAAMRFGIQIEGF
jgi:hypothetical protein